MPTFYVGGAAAVFTAVQDLEIDGGALRLRPRASYDTLASRPIWIFDANQYPYDPGVIQPVYQYRDLVEHTPILPERMAQDSSSKRFAGDLTASYSSRLDSGLSCGIGPRYDFNHLAFTMDIAFSISINAGVVAGVSGPLAYPTSFSWYCRYMGNVTKTLVFNIYGAAGVKALTVDVSTWALPTVAGERLWIDARIKYSWALGTYSLELRNGTTGNRLSGTSTDIIEIHKPTGFDRQTLSILAQKVFTTFNYLTTGMIGGAVQNAVYYDQYLPGLLADQTERPTFYSLLTPALITLPAATLTIDSGADDTVWDLSTLAADNEAAYATAFGGNGYFVVAVGSNNAVPNYSAVSTTLWSATKLRPNLTGRYLHLGHSCRSDGYSEFFPIRWISCEGAVSAAPLVTTLSAVENVTGGVKITFTPPATGDYTTTNFYQRIKGASAWTLMGGVAGAQGVVSYVTANIGEGGLAYNNYYEFIAVSESGGGYGPPSVVRHLFVHSGDYLLAALAALRAELAADSTLAAYVDSFNVQEWDLERLPAVKTAGIVISPVGRQIEGIGLQLKQDAADIQIHCLTPAWNNEDGLDVAQGIIDLANDVFNVINGNDCGGTIVPVTGLEAAGRVPFELLPGGHFYHAVVTLRCWLPEYQG